MLLVQLHETRVATDCYLCRTGWVFQEVTAAAGLLWTTLELLFQKVAI